MSEPSAWILGAQGLELRTPEPVAWMLAPLLRRELAAARRRHERLDPLLAAWIDQVLAVGARYEQREAARRSGVPVPVPEFRHNADASSSETMTTTEAAALLGCTARNVRAKASREALPATLDDSGRWRIDRNGVLDELERRRDAART